MIIRNIFHKIYVHPFFYIVAFLSAITGYFKEFLIFMLFIVVHEIGHIITSLFYGWNISKITLFPLGAITFFDEKINRPMKEEFFIAISGVLYQSIFFFLLSLKGNIKVYLPIHHFVLFFNILPIYPLDGSKILNLLFNYFLPFLRSFSITIGVSYGFLLAFLYLFHHNLVLVFVFFLFFYQVFKERKKCEFLFQKFLLERYLYSFSFPKIKKIKGYHLEKMKRDTYHLFSIQKETFLEKDILKSLFDNKR